MGGSKTTNNTTTTIPAEIRNRGTKITKAAMGNYFDPAKKYQTYKQGQYNQVGVDTTGQLNGYHDQASGQLQNAATGYQPYLASANTAANTAATNTASGVDGPNFSGAAVEKFMNPYTSNVIDQGVRRIQDEMIQGRLANQSRAALAGAFGGTRHAVLDAENQDNAMTNLSEFVGTQYARNYDQGLNQYNTDYSQGLQAQTANNQAAGQNFGQGMTLANFNTGMAQQTQDQALAASKGFLDFGNVVTAQEQAQKDNAYEKGYLDKRNYPMEVYERLAAMNAMQPINRTSTGTEKSSGGWLGPALQAGGSLAMMASDVHMKENIHERDPEDILGAFAEIRPYEYTYKDSARASNPDLTAAGVRRGFMAQDYERATGRPAGPTTPDGYKTVDMGNVLGDLVGAVHALEKRTRALKLKTKGRS